VTKLTALVVDDEQLARDELAYLLERQEGVEVVGGCTTASKPSGASKTSRPTSCFSTCRCPGWTGSRWPAARAARPRTEIVFVTAFDQFAIDGFQVNAVDYLLKPVDPARLEQAVQRAARRLAARAPGAGAAGLSNRIWRASPNWWRRSRPADGWLFASASGCCSWTDEIVYASVTADTVTIGAGTLTGVSNCRTLDELQACSTGRVLARASSHLVNINKIKEIVPGSAGTTSSG